MINDNSDGYEKTAGEVDGFAVYHSRNKLIAFSVLCAAAPVFFVVLYISQLSNHKANLPALAFVLFPFVPLFWLALYGTIQTLRSGTPAIIVNERGIFDNSGIAGGMGWIRWSDIRDVRLKTGLVEGGHPTLYIGLVDGAALVRSRPPGSTAFGRLRARLHPWPQIVILPSLFDVNMRTLYTKIETRRTAAMAPSASAG